MRRCANAFLPALIVSVSACVAEGAISRGGEGNHDGGSIPANDPTSPVVDVKTRGATGDGVTDDSVAVRQAFLDAIALGQAVVFPEGIYRLAAVIHIDVGAGKKLAIKGAHARVVGDAPEPASGVEIGQIDVSGPGDVAIEHLAIDLRRTARGALDALRFDGSGSVTLADVSARGASHWGIALVRASSGTVAGCNAEDNRYGGLGLEASANIMVSGGVYSRNGTVAPVDGYGVSCMSSAIGPSTNVVFKGIHADGNKRKGIDVHSGHNVTIDGNFVTGFDSAGIYAVNEDTGKDVRDITITNNVVDGTGAGHYVYGIEVGAFSALATESGIFTVRGNTVRNTAFTSSSAILIRNPTLPGHPPAKVIIDKNVIENGAAPDAYVVRGDNYDAPTGELVVTNNTIAAQSAVVAIGLLRATTATIRGNKIEVATGTVQYGIIVSAPASASIDGNSLLGAASYVVPIAFSEGQVLRMNTLRGTALPDQN